MSDYRLFINTYFGDQIFDEILDGIRDDVDGPQVDVRRDLVSELSDEFILVINKQQRGEVEAVMIAIPVRNSQRVFNSVKKVAASRPILRVQLLMTPEPILMRSVTAA